MMEAEALDFSRESFHVFAEGLPVAEDGPEHVHASSREGDDGLVVAFSLGALAVIEGPAIGAPQGCEGGLIEDALQGLVRASSAMTAASFGSDLRSPPRIPWRARFTARARRCMAPRKRILITHLAQPRSRWYIS